MPEENSSSLVSVVVVNWNGEKFLKECIDAILDQTYPSLELIVVDNGSTDSSLKILSSYENIRLIRNEDNKGFGTANNQALRIARGGFVGFVNNDTVLQPDWLASMLKPMRTGANVGMCAGKTMSYLHRDRIDNTGHLLYWDGINRGRGRMQEDRGQFDSAPDALIPSGCAGVFRKEMLDRIGGFDEDFFLYGDDMDLGLRGRLAGWECAFAPQAVAYHHYSGSSGSYHPMKFFYVERNRLWVVLKYFPLELIVLNPLFSFARYLFHAIALVCGRGVTGEFARDRSPWLLIRLWWKAQVSSWAGAGRCWRKRRNLQRQLHWNRRRFYRCILPHRLSVRELTFTS